VDVEPVGDVGLAVGEWPLPAGALPADGVLVEGDRPGPAVEVDVLHAERADGADAEAGVEQHLEEGLVARVVDRLTERADFVLGERLLGVDLAVGDGADLDVLGPSRSW